MNVPWSCWLSKYEITNAQYAEYLNIALSAGEVVRDGTESIHAVSSVYVAIPNNALFLRLGNDRDIRWSVNKMAPVAGREQKPVSVTWYGALAFAQHYGYDLPTTAEWEKAARGPDHDDEDEHLEYPWGSTLSAGYANYRFTGHGSEPTSGTIDKYTFAYKTPVGYFDGNQSPFGPDTVNGYGLYDVIGNVSEWTRTAPTVIESYPEQESLNFTDNILTNAATSRTHRGGSEANYWNATYTPEDEELMKLYYQSSADLDDFSTSTTSRVHMIGFRVIRRSN